MTEPEEFVGLLIYLTDGTQYQCVLGLSWASVIHGIVRDGFFSTEDFFVNRGSILKIGRVGVQAPAAQAPVEPRPSSSVLRPQFGVIRGLGGDPNVLPADQGGNLLQPIPGDLDADDVVARVEEGARVLYAQAGHFSPWDKADPGVKDHFRDQAARRIAPLAEDPPPAS